MPAMLDEAVYGLSQELADCEKDNGEFKTLFKLCIIHLIFALFDLQSGTPTTAIPPSWTPYQGSSLEPS